MFGFLKKKESKVEKVQEASEVNNLEKNSFALYLLFHKSFVLNKELIIKRINSIDGSRVEFDIMYDLDGKEALYCNIKINNDIFKLVGLEAPIPKEVFDYTINCAYGNKDELDRMKDHNYHVIAFYEGDSKDQNHIFNAYSKLAYGFLEHNLLGVANEYAWNALIPSLIEGMVEDKNAKILASTPAMMIWRNFIKIPHEDGVWFATKGNNLYGINEYAYFGTFKESNEVCEIFEGIFNYVYETKAQILAGHTLQIEEDVYLRFKEVYERQDVLEGESIGTLVIEKISSHEINGN